MYGRTLVWTNFRVREWVQAAARISHFPGDLLVLDDLFLTRRIALESAGELQSILDRRYKLRRSTLITSNRIIADWDKSLGDAALTCAPQIFDQINPGSNRYRTDC